MDENQGTSHLTREEIAVLQSTMIEQYKKVSIEQNNNVHMLNRLGVPFTEVQRLVSGCASVLVKDCFKEAPPPQPDQSPYSEFSKIVTYVREVDRDRTAYGNTPKPIDELYADYQNRAVMADTFSE